MLLRISVMAVPLVALAWICGVATLPEARAEKLTGTIADTRTTLAIKVNQAAVQRWLPAPWKARSVPKGPFKGANLFIVLIDRLLHRDAKGKPAVGGSYLMAAFLVPAVNPSEKRGAGFIVRVYSPQGAPGPYHNSVRASVQRETSQNRQELKNRSGSDRWLIKTERGGKLEFSMKYVPGKPKWIARTIRPHSAVKPSFYRIYRYEQLIDIVKSGPAAINRASEIRLTVRIPELDPMFDGSEELIGIAHIPWYRRQTLLP